LENKELKNMWKIEKENESFSVLGLAPLGVEGTA